jgi:hypothetical protein
MVDQAWWMALANDVPPNLLMFIATVEAILTAEVVYREEADA